MEKLNIWIIKSIDIAIEVYEKLNLPVNNIPYLLLMNECYERIKSSKNKDSNMALQILANKILTDIGDDKTKPS